MSSTQEASSGQGETSKKAERNRRTWTQKEELTLISALKEIISEGWLSDNSFRAGYLKKLELCIRREYPNTDLKSEPHIHSKMTSWKMSYNSLKELLKRSGVGFNLHGNHMIDCEDDQWAQIEKADENARTMRYKTWPYYEAWKEIFGNDLATGENAEDIVEAWNDLRKKKQQLSDGMPHGDKDVSADQEMNDMDYDRVSHSARDEQPSKKNPKKRKLNDELQGVCELLNEMTHSTNSRLEHLANRIGYEFDMGKARQETFDQLGEIPGLSLENRFVICELVAFKAERLDIWKGMKSDSCAQYVDHLLKTMRGQ